MGNAGALCQQSFGTASVDHNLFCTCERRTFQESYELGKQLGKGAQGRVHLCLHRGTGEKRAVKIFDRTEGCAYSTYNRELQYLQACESDFLIRAWDHFVDSDACYLVLERFACHLRKALKWVAKEDEGHFPLGNRGLRNIMQQAFAAVLHLHRYTVVHRDVKAQNLLADRLDLREEECRVVLSDFGFAHALRPGEVLCSQVGTRKYWPPEVWDGRYWHAMDIFALGVMGFLASTGTFPYEDEDMLRTRNVFQEPGLIPETLEPEARDFMMRCLEKDPTERITAQALSNTPWLFRDTGGREQVLSSRHCRSTIATSVFGKAEGVEDSGRQLQEADVP